MESVKKTTESHILSKVRENTIVIVEKILSGTSLKSRLAELGIYPGMTLKIIRNSKKGPVIVNVKDSTFMLGRGMADKIIVR